MKNNKVVMSLVLASISAMAAAPAFIQTVKDKNDNKGEEGGLKQPGAQDTATNTGDILDLAALPSAHASVIDEQTQGEMVAQLDAMLMKKTPIEQLSESITVLVDNYGEEDTSLRQEIYKELNFAQANPDDSTTLRQDKSILGTGGPSTGGTLHFCHSACHSACHTACHGSRGWR